MACGRGENEAYVSGRCGGWMGVLCTVKGEL